MDNKVYEPEVIQDVPFPGETSLYEDSRSSKESGDSYTPNTTRPKAFRQRKFANELLSEALNTRSRKILQQFDLVQSGGFRIGEYQEGISGDLRITPNGITARDLAGLTTFALDGTTGSAVFKGSVQAGSFISGSDSGVTVGPTAGVNGADFTDLQSAIDYINDLGGGNVFVQAGTYVINNSVNIPGNIHIIGEDVETTIFDMNLGGAIFTITNVSNVSIDNIHFKNWRTSSSVNNALIISITTSGLTNKKIWIRNCKFSNTRNSSAGYNHYDIYADFSLGGIKNCEFSESAGVYWGAINSFMTENRFYQLANTAIQVISSNTIIQSNIFSSCTSYAIYSEDDLQQVIISQNVFGNHKGPAAIMLTEGIDSINIVNNTAIGGIGAGDFLDLGANLTNAIVANNSISSFTNGIKIAGSDKVVVTGNNISSNSAYAVTITSGTSNFIHGNLFDSNGSGGLNDAGTSTTNTDNVTI